MNTTKKVIDILKKLSGLEDIDESNQLHSDLALDSLSMVTLLIEVEDTFQIELDESDINPFELATVNDIINLVRKYYGEQNEQNC